MGNRNFQTQQQQNYEQNYKIALDDYGIPDRKIIHEQKNKNQSILSLGSGSGNDVWYLSSDNFIVGLDYALSGLQAGKQHNIQGIIGDLNFHRYLPFRDQSFDVVILKDILEHLLEPLDILKEAARVLKDDGYMIVSVPNHFFLPFRIKFLLGQGLIWKTAGKDHGRDYEEWNYMHIRFFTYKGFTHFLKQAEIQPDYWFWDFGTLAHYQNPDMWLEPQSWKKINKKPISSRGNFGLRVISPLWKVFNFILPYKFRRAIVSLAPGLLCAGFYVRVKKTGFKNS